MKKKGVTISPSQLIRFLDQELNELPDKRKGDNKKYAIKDALIAAFSVFFHPIAFFLTTSTFDESKTKEKIMLKVYLV